MKKLLLSIALISLGGAAFAQSSQSGSSSGSQSVAVVDVQSVAVVGGDTTIVNTSLGIGLTEDAPDFSLGVSLPINFSGLKE